MTDMEIYGLRSEDEWRTRDDLMSMSGMKDRPIRAALNRLRKNWRTMIISSSNGKGYKILNLDAPLFGTITGDVANDEILSNIFRTLSVS